MKRLLLILLLFIPFLALAQNPTLANPFYLVFTLIDQPDETKMEEICNFYSLSDNGEIDGFHSYSHNDGTKLYFKTETQDGRTFPIVRITTKESGKNIEKFLHGAGFAKEGNEYVKGSRFESRQTKCKITREHPTTLEFYKIYLDNL